jgi:hypothetical protein
MAGTEPRVGMRLRCGSCGSEAIITKLGDNAALECCGAPMEPAGPTGAGGAASSSSSA